MNNGDKIEFYYQSQWNEGFYVGKFPPAWKYVVVVTDDFSYIIDKDKVRELPKKKVKPLKELVNTLIDAGYLPNEEGAWMKKGHLGFNPLMFSCCGKEPDKQFSWEEAWLEVESMIPPKDRPVMVRQYEDWAWEKRYSTGKLDSDGKLICYNFVTNSQTATGETAWKFYREPTLEEMKK